jgi:hypothetical protein
MEFLVFSFPFLVFEAFSSDGIKFAAFLIETVG